MDGAQGYLAYCEAVRDPEDSGGQIVDFFCTRTNETVNQLIGLPGEQIVGQRMTAFFPSMKESGLFEKYCAVVETGQPQRFELHYPYDGFDNYTDVQAAPLGADGLVISYSFISELKKSQLAQQ
ncbi:MAG: PAS domain-containing protein [Cytophagaceae bacterium]|nr:PAS domain-containing protein [Cytophagaceae bacterium]